MLSLIQIITNLKIMVNKAKKYIYEGEIFQVVLSRIFKKKIETDPFSGI